MRKICGRTGSPKGKRDTRPGKPNHSNMGEEVRDKNDGNIEKKEVFWRTSGDDSRHMSKAFLLLTFIPSFISADTLCPNGETTCPENKQCCEIDGEHSCCDPADGQDISDMRKKVFPGVEIMSPAMSSPMFSNSSFSTFNATLQNGVWCDLFCSGTCCEGGCCKHSKANCCDNDGCCPSLQSCCKNYCCDKTKKCCDAGCCPKGGDCCGDGCCRAGFKCCGAWCCSQIANCGTSYQTCVSDYQTDKGAIFSTGPAVLLVLVASIFVSHRL